MPAQENQKIWRKEGGILQKYFSKWQREESKKKQKKIRHTRKRRPPQPTTVSLPAERSRNTCRPRDSMEERRRPAKSWRKITSGEVRTHTRSLKNKERNKELLTAHVQTFQKRQIWMMKTQRRSAKISYSGE